MTLDAAELEPAHEPLLSILIPTYNRKARLRALVAHLLPFVAEFNGAIELVVSNNCSTDGTESVMPPDTQFFRAVNRVVHLPTAEENVFESISLCRGTYVWCHGDDDIPNLHVVRYTMELLASRNLDFLLFNSLFLDARGLETGGAFLSMKSEIRELPFAAGACAAGLTTTFAGFTNSIQRRSHLIETDWRPFFKISPIYSHVVWWLLAFRDCRMTFVNKPICGYRDADVVLSRDHFARVAEKSQRADFHFWTSGLSDLLQMAEDLKAISPSDIASACEVRADGTRFRLLDNLVNLTFLQVLRGVETGDKRNLFSVDELTRLTDWILRIDPGYFECMSIIGKLAADVRTGASKLHQTSRSVRSDFSRLLTEKEVSNNLQAGYMGELHGFAIYKHICGYVALAVDHFDEVERMPLLRAIDFDPRPDVLLVADSIVDLTEKIGVARTSLASKPFDLPRERLNSGDYDTRIAAAIETHARAILEAARFPQVTLARSLAWRLGRLVGKFAERLKRRNQSF